MSIEIRWTSGETETYQSLALATEAILEEFADAVIFESDDDRLALVWANEDDADNDDGSKAIASIWEEVS